MKEKVKKTVDVHGVKMTSLEEMMFGKWCSHHGVAMNTYTPEQRTELAQMYLNNAKSRLQ